MTWIEHGELVPGFLYREDSDTHQWEVLYLRREDAGTFLAAPMAWQPERELPYEMRPWRPFRPTVPTGITQDVSARVQRPFQESK